MNLSSMVILAGVMLGFVPASGERAEPAPAGAAPASALAFAGADHATHTFAELRGHPAVVNFWATWCGPCKEEMPRLQKLADAYAAQNVRFVAISLDAPETQSRIPEVAQKRGFRLPIWTGATEKTLAALDLGELVPATLVLAENGQIIGKIEGEARDKDIRSRLDWLLAGRPGKAPKLIQKNDW